MIKLLFIWFFCGISILAGAQVDEIKSLSKENSSQSSKEGETQSSKEVETEGGDGGWFFDLLFTGIPEWQSMKLTNNRENYPAMVSLDVMLQ